MQRPTAAQRTAWTRTQISIRKIASAAGFKVFAPGGTAYSARKLAVRALTEGQRMEHRADNILA